MGMASLQPRQLGQILIDLVASGATHEQLGALAMSLSSKHPSMDESTYGMVLAAIATTEATPDTVGSFVLIQEMRRKAPDKVPLGQSADTKRKFTIGGSNSVNISSSVADRYIEKFGTKNFQALGKKIFSLTLAKGQSRSRMFETALISHLTDVKVDS